MRVLNDFVFSFVSVTLLDLKSVGDSGLGLGS